MTIYRPEDGSDLDTKTYYYNECDMVSDEERSYRYYESRDDCIEGLCMSLWWDAGYETDEDASDGEWEAETRIDGHVSVKAKFTPRTDHPHARCEYVEVEPGLYSRIARRLTGYADGCCQERMQIVSPRRGKNHD
jgi:hypothetical protein